MWFTEIDEEPTHPAWDDWVATVPGGHHLQTSGWGYVKADAGWRATRILVRDGGQIVGGCQLLVRSVPLIGAIGYDARRRRILLLKVQPPVNRTDLPELLG